MKSSLAFQLLLYLGSYYFGCFIFIEFLLLIYKSTILPYPPGNLLSEVHINKLFIFYTEFIILLHSVSSCPCWLVLKSAEYSVAGKETSQKTQVSFNQPIYIYKNPIFQPQWLSPWLCSSPQYWVLSIFSCSSPMYSGNKISIWVKIDMITNPSYRLEAILCCVQLSIQGLQLVFGLVTAAAFSKAG